MKKSKTSLFEWVGDVILLLIMLIVICRFCGFSSPPSKAMRMSSNGRRISSLRIGSRISTAM